MDKESRPLLSRHCQPRQERAVVLRGGLLSIRHSAPFFSFDPKAGLQPWSQRQKAALLHRGCLCWTCEHRAKCGNVFPMDILSTAPESKSHRMSSEARLIAAGNHLFPCWTGVSKCSFYSLVVLPAWCPWTLCHYLSLHPFSLRAGKAYGLLVSTPSLRLSKILSVA